MTGGGKINHISMQKNQIGCQGVKYLAEAISKGVFPNLEWLFLAENQIGDEGVTALAQAPTPHTDTHPTHRHTPHPKHTPPHPPPHPVLLSLILLRY